MGKQPAVPPSIDSILERLRRSPERLGEVLLRVRSVPDGIAPGGKYRHWDTLRHLKPPEDLTSEEWWLAVKLARAPLQREIPLSDAEGRSFTYTMPDEALELVHYIDQHASGEMAMPDVITESESARRHFLVNSLIEEAIRSSQLEGATTSRAVAKDMIRTGRPPANRSEQMILNNYRALEFIREQVDSPLTSEVVLTLQRILTEGTLDNPDAAGRLQLPGEERVAVYDRHDGSLLHMPPPAEDLPSRMDAMCRFANGVESGRGFIHPVVRAILLHFWLAYDHPFEDGNGRTARALFYWAMKRQEYWLTEYLSISRILRKAPSRYTMAYLYSETDDRDTTYFVLYQLDVIRRAIEELRAYLRRKMEEVREVEALIRQSDEFNHRQLAVLAHALRHPHQRYTFDSHRRSHRVTYQTARTDLLNLRDRGLLQMTRSGKQFVFRPAENLIALVGRLSSDSAS